MQEKEMKPEDFIEDVPLANATAAHAGTSHVPDERGRQEREGYARTLAADWENLSRYAGTDDKRATLAEAFARYRNGYRQRYLAYLTARSLCLSTMVTGPSNFPTARNRKRSDAADKRTSELIEYRERALESIRKELQPELQPIMKGDADAAERLQQKIAHAEAQQERMRKANAAIRKAAKAGSEAQVAALISLEFSEGVARELIKPDFAGRVGFADYQLKNNGAEIRRLKSRLAEVERAKSEQPTELEGERARVEDCPADNRVRLRFPGKPPADVRQRLKRSGFRWAPSLGCWQAYRNHGAIEVAKREARGRVQQGQPHNPREHRPRVPKPQHHDQVSLRGHVPQRTRQEVHPLLQVRRRGLRGERRRPLREVHMIIEGVPYYRFAVRFTLADGRRRRRYYWSPGFPWVYDEVGQSLLNEFGLEGIKPHSCTIREAFK